MPKTFDDYATDLERLVEKARDAVFSGADARMKAVHRDLFDFQADSDDRIDGVIELDRVASNTMRDVTLARLDQSLIKNLSERSADIARLLKTFSTQAASNSSAASVLRLERAKAVLTAGATVVDELKKLGDLVDPSTTDGKKLTAAIADAIAAVSTVQQQLAKG